MNGNRSGEMVLGGGKGSACELMDGRELEYAFQVLGICVR